MCDTEEKKMPVRTSRRGGDGGGGGRQKSPTSLTTLPQECGSLHRLSKKYLLPLEKQSTTPIVHYTFHYIELVPVSAAVYREVKHVNLCLCSRGHVLRGITRYNCFKG